jgi:hypothetical protein
VVVAGVVFVAAALLVATAVVVRRSREANPAELRRLSRTWAWTGFVLAAVPSTAWLVLWLSGGEPKALTGLGALVLSAAPVVAAYRFPRLLPVSLVVCLLASISVGAAWRHLYVLLPLALALTGVWLLALGTHLRAETDRKTPVQRRDATRP